MKKLLIVPAVVIAMLFGSVVNAVVEPSFNDVGDETSYVSSILWMANNGVIQGYPDGTFKPDQCVNRAEFLKMMYLTRGPEMVVSDGVYGITIHEDAFSDTSTDQWYWPYVNAALEEGLVEGYPDGTFKPGQCVNRVEAIKMGLLGFYDGSMPNYEELLLWGFEDVDKSAWYGEYAEAAFSKELVGLAHAEITTVESGKFFPGESMSRKEVAEMLFRTSVVINNNLDRYSANKPPRAVNYYVSPSSGVSFILPADWTVTHDAYYETPGGPVADYPTIRINGPVEEIGGAASINQRMTQCGTGEYDATCFNIAEGYTLGSYAPTAETMRMINLVMLTFKEPISNGIIIDPTVEIAFDGCETITNYVNEDWWTDFVTVWDDYMIDAPGYPPHHEALNTDVGDSCLALNKSMLVFIPDYLINNSKKIYKYDVVNNVLEITTADAWYDPEEFGAREGDYINVYVNSNLNDCTYIGGHYYYLENRYETVEGSCTI